MKLPPNGTTLTLGQAIEAVTINPAWQVRMEHKLGSLEVGKYADIVVLDHNLFDIKDPDQILDAKILGTMMDGVIKEAKDGPKYMFVSFDIDTLDLAFVPGTGTPEPGGLTPREAFPIVRRLCAESNVVGFELVELAPMLDPTYVSALNANRLIRECMTGIAMRKKGLTDPHYLSPLTKTHGQESKGKE